MSETSRGARVLLADGWSAWPSIWVRAAGFPARDVLELAASDATEAADRLLRAESEARTIRARARDELWQLHHAGGELARAARGAVEQLERGKLPRNDATLEEHAHALRALRRAEDTVLEHREELGIVYAAAMEATTRRLVEIARNPRFREAVLWQNRGALHSGVDWLLAHPTATNSQARQKHALIASYVQRYCVKNDTIGFFGPIAWGTAVASNEVSLSHGPRAFREREVHFEHWAIDAIAAAISAWPEVRPMLAPRLVPTARVNGTTLQYGFDLTAPLPPVILRVLERCDGETPAAVIARDVCADAALEIERPDEVYELLDDLVSRKLITWTLEPAAITAPERKLRELVGRFENLPVRDRALAMVDQLDAARRSVASADLARLDRALSELDATFTELTGAAATRRSGETYAARTIVYEDCVSDTSLIIGKPVIDRFGPVFALVAASARWFTHEVASRYTAAITERFRALRATTGGPVHYLQLWQAIADLLPDSREPGPIAGGIVAELQRRWESILDLDTTQHRVELTVAGLKDAVRTAFAAPHPGWPSARHISPDVMIAANSIEELVGGQALIVLGEVHIGNTQTARFLIPHGPSRDVDVLVAEYESDHPAPRVLAVEARHRVTRADNVSWSHGDFDLELGDARSWRARECVLRAGDLVVEEQDGAMLVRDLRSNRPFDVISIMASYLDVMVINCFVPAPRSAHIPRVTIDDVVLCREKWTFQPAQLPAATDVRADMFARIRAWARDHHIPRWTFAKIPEEPKPVFIDFASPLCVEMLAKWMRGCSRLSITEMLPTPDQAWLTDQQGDRYTSELRFVMLDPTAR